MGIGYLLSRSFCGPSFNRDIDQPADMVEAFLAHANGRQRQGANTDCPTEQVFAAALDVGQDDLSGAVCSGVADAEPGRQGVDRKMEVFVSVEMELDHRLGDPEPQFERQTGSVQGGAGGDRILISAAIVLKSFASSHPCGSIGGTFGQVGPAGHRTSINRSRQLASSGISLATPASGGVNAMVRQWIPSSSRSVRGLIWFGLAEIALC